MDEAQEVVAPSRTPDGRLVCAGCLQPMNGMRGVFSREVENLAWHDPECASMWAMKMGYS
jgi:hypothetical protein